MNEPSKKIATPAYLQKRLETFKIVKGSDTSYVIRDKVMMKTYDFEPWQFFVLEVLPGCEDFTKLETSFQDRFGYPLKRQNLTDFFAQLGDWNILDGDEAATHPLLAPYAKKTYVVEDGEAKVKSFITGEAMPAAPPAPAMAAIQAVTIGSTSAPPPPPPPPKPAPPPNPNEPLDPNVTLAPGIQDAAGLDPREGRTIFRIFDPRPALKVLSPIVTPVKYAVYVLPFFALVAFFIGYEYFDLIDADLTALRAATTLLEHVLFSLVTVNLSVTATTAFVAYAYRATVNTIGISIYVGFLPRFIADVSNTEQLSRRERMWLHAAPLLTRVALLSIGLLLWYNTRDDHGVLAPAGLGIAIICAIDLTFASANPLVKGSGYHLLSAFLDESHLRGKAYQTLLNKFSGKVYKEADNSLLAAYALAIFLYGYFLIVVVTIAVGIYLKGEQVGGTAIILALAVGIYLVSGTINRFKKIGEAYERSQQFDRWRNRTLPTEFISETEEAKKPKTFTTYLKIALPLMLLIVLFLPYPYEPGGKFTVFPDKHEEITTDVPGLVEQVYFDGGETVKKGVPIARLSHTDYLSDVRIYTAKVAEQQAELDDLKTRPKPEEVKVAEREVDIASRHETFSKAKVPRMQHLYDDHAISFEELETARKEYEVDIEQRQEKQAALALVKAGVTADQIKAAEAKLQSLKEELASYVDKIGRTVLYMPFDGNILTLHLQQRVNSYLDKGKSFATIENIRAVTAQIEVPESDIQFVTLGATVDARPNAYNESSFNGKVTIIDRNVTFQSFGTVVKVIAEIDNRDERLKTGMTGYAKVKGVTLPVWKAFTQALIRFFNIQVWSWIP